MKIVEHSKSMENEDQNEKGWAMPEETSWKFKNIPE